MAATATRRKTAGVNGTAVVSVICAVLAVAGLFVLGAAVLAVFAHSIWNVFNVVALR